MATIVKKIQNTLKYWYVPAIIGILFIVMGVYLFTVPEATYLSLVILFSLSFLITGILETWFSIQNREDLEGWGWYLASGLFSLLIGIVLILRPEIAATTLPFFVGFSLLFRSFQGLGFAFEVKKHGVINWGNLAIISILGLIFSFFLIANPIFTSMSLVVLTALAFIFPGIHAIILSFQLRKLKRLPKTLKKEFQSKMDALKNEYYNRFDD